MLDTIIYTYSANFLLALYTVGTIFIGYTVWYELFSKRPKKRDFS